LRVSIKNFGPVREAEIDLRPLVVFVGPNNAGKSLIATILYASLSQTGVASSLKVARAMRSIPWDDVFEDIIVDVYEFLEAAIKDGGRNSYRLMSDPVRQFFTDRLRDSLFEYTVSVAEEITRTTGVGSLEKIRRRSAQRANTATLKISSETPAWEVQLTVKHKEHGININVPANLQDVWRSIPSSAWRRVSRPTVSRSFRLREFVSELARACFREVPLHTKYLPAARSGLLQSHKALAGSLMRRSTFAGIEDLQVPAMTGVVTDFLAEMVQLDSTAIGNFAEEAAMLESQILRGEIGLVGNGDTNPEVLYRTSAGDYPLGRTSSMVSELAPVVLYLRHRLRTGDLLLIEEPEAHLHPGTQVAFAKSIVRLVNSGLRITFTTHSEFFLQQINNAIAASTIPAGQLDEGIYLKPDNIAAYLFKATPHGSLVTSIPIAPDGISDATFSEVYSRLYNEAVALDRSRRRVQQK
jgi:predicted ATPase